MLTVLFSDCWKVAPRTNAAKAMQYLYTVAQFRRLVLCVMSKCGILLPIDNEMCKLARKTFHQATAIEMEQQHDYSPTQGYFVGCSINLAKKIADAAISDGG